VSHAPAEGWSKTWRAVAADVQAGTTQFHLRCCKQCSTCMCSAAFVRTSSQTSYMCVSVCVQCALPLPACLQVQGEDDWMTKYFFCK
jgi:hypothetical protein